MTTAKPGESCPLPGGGPASDNEHRGPRGGALDRAHSLDAEEGRGWSQKQHTVFFWPEQLKGQ